MPITCTVCSKNFYSYQSRIECTSCQRWVHHDNRYNCSGLSDAEYKFHIDDQFKPFECDFCLQSRISTENFSTLSVLPFPCEPGPPPKTTYTYKDVTSITHNALKRFLTQCESIESNSALEIEDDNDEDGNGISVKPKVNSKYHSIKQLRSIK